jgi:hypothetical protein
MISTRCQRDRDEYIPSTEHPRCMVVNCTTHIFDVVYDISGGAGYISKVYGA